MNLKEIFENKLKIETKVVSIESVFSEVKVKRTHPHPVVGVPFPPIYGSGQETVPVTAGCVNRHRRC